MSSTSSGRILIASFLLVLLVTPSIQLGNTQSGSSISLMPQDEAIVQELLDFPSVIDKTKHRFFPPRNPKFEAPPYNLAPDQVYSHLGQAIFALGLIEQCDYAFDNLDFKLKCDEVHDVLMKCGQLSHDEQPLNNFTKAGQLPDYSAMRHRNTLNPKLETEFANQFKKLKLGGRYPDDIKPLLDKIRQYQLSPVTPAIKDSNVFSADDRKDVLFLFVISYTKLVLYSNMAKFNPADSAKIPNYDTSYRYFVSAMLITDPDDSVRDFSGELNDIAEYLNTIGAVDFFTGDKEPEKTRKFAETLPLIKMKLSPVPFEGVLYHSKNLPVSREFSILIDPESPKVFCEALQLVLAENYWLVKEKRANEKSLDEWIHRKFYFYALYKFYEAHQTELEQHYNDLSKIPSKKKPKKSLLKRLWNMLDWKFGVGLALVAAVGTGIKLAYDKYYPHTTPPPVTNSTNVTSLVPIPTGPGILTILLWTIGAIFGALGLAFVGYFVYTRVTERDPLSLLFWIKRTTESKNSASSAGKQVESSKKQRKGKSATTVSSSESMPAVLPPTSPKSVPTTETSTKKEKESKEKTRTTKAEKSRAVSDKKSTKSKAKASSIKQKKESQSEASDASENASTKKSIKSKAKASSSKQKKETQSEASDASESASTKKSTKKKRSKSSSHKKKSKRKTPPSESKKKEEEEDEDEKEESASESTRKRKSKRKRSSKRRKKKKSSKR